MEKDPFQKLFQPWTSKNFTMKWSSFAFLYRLVPRINYSTHYSWGMLPYRIKYNGVLVLIGSLIAYKIWNAPHFYSGNLEKRTYYTTEMSLYGKTISYLQKMKYQKEAAKQNYIA